jgi:hypothetical protein
MHSNLKKRGWRWHRALCGKSGTGVRTALADEKIHGRSGSVKDDPVTAQDPSSPASGPFDFRAAKINVHILVFDRRLLFSHLPVLCELKRACSDDSVKAELVPELMSKIITFFYSMLKKISGVIWQKSIT